MFEQSKPSLKAVLPAELNISYADSVQSPFVGELLDLLAPQFEERLRQYKEEDGFIELVRRTIQDKLTGHRPSIDAVSQALHMGRSALVPNC